MGNTSIYLSNARLTPSSYYRLTQYFSDTDASIHSSVPDSIYQWWHHKGKNGSHLNKVFLYAVYVFRTLWFLLKDMMVMRQGTVIVSRVIVPHHLPMIHQLLFKHLAHHNHIVWDFDDNILANKSCSPADFQFFSKYSNQIIVTNDFLQSLISPEYREKVMILPTTDGDMLAYDPTAYFEYRRYLFQKEIRLVWVATASGLEYIKAIIPALDKAAQKLTEGNTKELTLHIVCNKPLQAETTHLTIVNIPWSREVARQEMLHAHIGIMPLPDTPFTRGKGGFKLIQYMSVSMPVIGSDVGFNKQVVTNDIGFLIANDNEEEGWQRAIQALTVDWSTYLCYAKSAKARYDQFYSYQKNKDFWEKICKQ